MNSKAFAAICYVAAFILLMFVPGAHIHTVFIGLAPFMLYILAYVFWDLAHEKKHLLSMGLPIVLSFLSYLVWMIDIPVLNQLEAGPLAIVNVLFCYATQQIIEIGETEKAKTAGRQISPIAQPIEFSKSLRGIEDKCKALNFAIGRVYSDKKGGTPEIRNKIKIAKETYNEFSDMASDFREENAQQLIRILDKIQEKLELMELPENRVFRIGPGILPIERNLLGQDRIIDVLAMNDKDPVREYHKEAKEICQRLKEKVRQSFK